MDSTRNTIGTFNASIVGNDVCPPHYKLLENMPEGLRKDLGLSEGLVVGMEPMEPVNVPLTNATSRVFGRAVTTVMRFLLRYATSNSSNKLLELHTRMKMDLRKEYTLQINDRLREVPVVEAYCILLIKIVLEEEEPWDTKSRVVKAQPAYVQVQSDLLDAAKKAWDSMPSVQLIKDVRQSHNNVHITPAVMWEFYAAIGIFVEAMLQMVESIEEIDLDDDHPDHCIRCRNEILPRKGVAVTIISESRRMVRCFAHCSVCAKGYCAFTRMTKRQKKRVRDSDDEDDEEAGESRKRQKGLTFADRLHRREMHLESLKMLLRLVGIVEE
jgi:hypothetical protein